MFHATPSPAVQVQEQLCLYGLDEIASVLVEGFSRVRRCTHEGRALMSLDLQVGDVTTVVKAMMVILLLHHHPHRRHHHHNQWMCPCKSLVACALPISPIRFVSFVARGACPLGS